MKQIAQHYVMILLSALSFSACSDGDLMLYHPEPEPEPTQKSWYLQQVGYPEQELGLTDRKDLIFSYSSDFSINKIENLAPEALTIDYKDGWVIYSRIRQSTTGNNVYDSIHVKLDNNNRALCAFHGTSTEYIDEDGNPKIESGVIDSTAFIYNGEGYLVQLERYASSVSAKPTYTETRTVENGNIIQIETSSQYKYTYTYDGEEHSIPAEFCYEMPGNTRSLAKGGCWTLTNLAFLSDYLGKRNSNNVESVEISQYYDTDPFLYANLTYTYTFNDDDLVSQVRMLGVVNEAEVPDNYITSFSYLEVEK